MVRHKRNGRLHGVLGKKRTKRHVGILRIQRKKRQERIFWDERNVGLLGDILRGIRHFGILRDKRDLWNQRGKRHLWVFRNVFRGQRNEWDKRKERDQRH